MTPRAWKKAYDIISIGDATLDTFIPIEDASVHCDLRKDACLLCLSYADKIAVERPVQTVGGNAANNAVGMARLGLKAALYVELGSDETGERVLRKLKKEGVSTEYARCSRGKETNTAFVLNHKGERTIFVYHADRDYRLPKLKDASWLYLTSIGKNHLSLHAEVLAWLKKHDAKMAFNPGTHQLKQGLEKLRSVLAAATVVFVNKEEAKRLVGDIDGIKDLLAALRRTGPDIAVITDGERGSYAHDGFKYWKCGTTETPVVERTGAGDAFATGFVAAMIRGEDVPAALRWGTMNSGSVITEIGPQAGLLTKSRMASWLRKYARVKAATF